MGYEKAPNRGPVGADNEEVRDAPGGEVGAVCTTPNTLLLGVFPRFSWNGLILAEARSSPSKEKPALTIAERLCGSRGLAGKKALAVLCRASIRHP